MYNQPFAGGREADAEREMEYAVADDLREAADRRDETTGNEEE